MILLREFIKWAHWGTDEGTFVPKGKLDLILRYIYLRILRASGMAWLRRRYGPK